METQKKKGAQSKYISTTGNKNQSIGSVEKSNLARATRKNTPAREAVERQMRGREVRRSPSHKSQQSFRNTDHERPKSRDLTHSKSPLPKFTHRQHANIHMHSCTLRWLTIG